jgi:serine phosphatase RsbU (regulator of sigma subunit)
LKEKNQLSLEKQEILENQKGELERQVIIRTEELQVANEEIQTVNNYLEDTLITVERQRDDTLSSIRYAQRIQNAILPRPQFLYEILPEHFIFFQPRDVVSGDFYWCAKVKSLNSNNTLTEKVILAVIDCTGHGVPGAFMSLIGHNLLNTIVNEKKITQADQIVNQLHKDVRSALQQKDNTNSDGMDMVLIVIDKENQILEFTGAKNPLVYIQNGQLNQLKGDRISVGGKQKGAEHTFTLQTLDISQPTSLYMYSDGYQDQFGGKSDRKFMSKRLKELLLNIHIQPMSEQHEVLQETMAKHIAKGKTKQVDDILVVGLRF